MARPIAISTASILMEHQSLAHMSQRLQKFTIQPELTKDSTFFCQGHDPLQTISRQDVKRYRAADQPPLGRVELAPLEPICRYVQRTPEGVTEQPTSRVLLDSFPTQNRMPRPTPKAKSNGKVERTQHSTRRHHGTSKRAADTREGQSQHSPAKKSHRSPSIRHTTSPHTPRRKKERTRASRSTSRSASTDSEREGRKGSRRRKNPDPPSSSDCSTSEDDDNVHDRPKHTLKQPKFDGKGSFETFMAQFMNYAKHNKWTRADKLAYLHNSLDKEAANILLDYGTEVTESLSGLTRILESRFGGQAVSDKLRIEL